MSKHERWGSLCYFCEESWPCETVTLRAENARLREQVEALADALRQERHDLRWTLIALPGNHWPQYRIDDVYPAMPHIVRAIKEGVANE